MLALISCRPDAGRPSSASSSSIVASAAPSASAAAPSMGTPADWAAAYERELLPMLCDHAVRGGAIGASQRADCLRGPGGRGLDHVWAFWHFEERELVDEEAKKGRYVHVPAAGEACLKKMKEELGAGPASPLLSQLVRPCAHMARPYFAPAVARGGACRRSDECIDGRCDARDGGEGTCVARRPKGEACVADECAEGNVCRPIYDRARPDQFGECAPPLREGDACPAPAGCAEGLFCQHEGREPGRCRRELAAGEICATVEEVRVCGAGLMCDFGKDPPVCAAPLAEGAVCSTDDACGEGLRCRGLQHNTRRHKYGSTLEVARKGKCTRLGDVGESCVPSDEVSGCPASMECDAQTRQCRLRTRR
ncbi:Hypothetical protein A7982_05789 [Minicystis rosea]|nr:Hypothetical protein A7982_05789 [Minicystis rosea]